MIEIDPIQASHRLVGASVIQGVSLANQAFNKAYAHELCGFLTQAKARTLDIVVFDAIEPINQRVFRGFDCLEASQATQHRAAQIVAMFQHTQRAYADTGTRIDVCLETGHPVYLGELFGVTSKILRNAYSACDQFRQKVWSQVFANLVKRREKYGDDFVHHHINQLSQYILDELAFFYSFYALRTGVAEVYPGPCLFIKECLFDGSVKELQPISRPLFLDTSFLLAHSHE